MAPALLVLGVAAVGGTVTTTMALCVSSTTATTSFPLKTVAEQDLIKRDFTLVGVSAPVTSGQGAVLGHDSAVAIAHHLMHTFQIREAALATVRSTRLASLNGKTVWAVSMMPPNGILWDAGEELHLRYYVMLLDATTGHFLGGRGAG